MKLGTEITPSFEGLPLPIILRDRPERTAETVISFHHHFHPEPSELLKGDSGLAVRICRGQDLPGWQHRRAHNLFAGPILPIHDADKMDIVLRAIAGDVPAQGIYFNNSGGFTEVALSEADKEALRATKNIHIEDAFSTPNQQRFIRNRIGLFIAQYCGEQDLNLAAGLIDQFLHDSNPVRSIELGNQFLADALQEVVRPVEAKRRVLLASGEFWQMGQPIALYSLAKNFFVRERFKDYRRVLRRRLGGDALQTEVNAVELAS